MRKGVGEGTGGNYDSINRGCLGHWIGRRGKLHGLDDALSMDGRDVHSLAPVVLHSAAQVPTIDSMGSRRAPLVWCFVHQHLCARRGEGSSIKVKGAIYMGLGRQSRVYS